MLGSGFINKIPEEEEDSRKSGDEGQLKLGSSSDFGSSDDSSIDGGEEDEEQIYRQIVAL